MVNAEVWMVYSFLDGFLVHMLMPHKCKTLDDYAEKAFLPGIATSRRV